MELIRHNIFDVIHESITLTADYKSALDVIDSEIQTSRDLCESIAQGGCTEIAGDIQARIRVPDEVGRVEIRRRYNFYEYQCSKIVTILEVEQ